MTKPANNCYQFFYQLLSLSESLLAYSSVDITALFRPFLILLNLPNLSVIKVTLITLNILAILSFNFCLSSEHFENFSSVVIRFVERLSDIYLVPVRNKYHSANGWLPKKVRLEKSFNSQTVGGIEQ